jgi:hypothetical protein
MLKTLRGSCDHAPARAKPMNLDGQTRDRVKVEKPRRAQVSMVFFSSNHFSR